MGGMPKGWLDYCRMGKQVPGTRFIAFKVPLKEQANAQVSSEHRFSPGLAVELIPNLGLVIDLTNTAKYYPPSAFESQNIGHVKILTEGKQIPSFNCYSKFREAVHKFYADNEHNDKLIGVHCTHGLNRTGFLVCRYMIEELNIAPGEAISAFETARGHEMKYKDFKEQLKRYNYLPSLAIDSETEKGTQTNGGYWVSDAQVHHRNKGHAKQHRAHTDPQQVSLTGCANIAHTDLIPDGRGGYFVHLRECDIMPNRPAPAMNSRASQRPMPRAPNNGVPMRPSPYPHSTPPPPMMQQAYRPHYPIPPPQQQWRQRPHNHHAIGDEPMPELQQQWRQRPHNHHAIGDDQMPESLLNRQQQHRRRFEANGPHYTHQKMERRF